MGRGVGWAVQDVAQLRQRLLGLSLSLCLVSLSFFVCLCSVSLSPSLLSSHDVIIIIIILLRGVFTQAAEHAPLWTHGRRQVSVYILVPSKTLNCSHGHMVSTDNADTSSAVVNARGGGGRRLPEIWCGEPRSPVSLLPVERWPCGIVDARDSHEQGVGR